MHDHLRTTPEIRNVPNNRCRKIGHTSGCMFLCHLRKGLKEPSHELRIFRAHETTFLVTSTWGPVGRVSTPSLRKGLHWCHGSKTDANEELTVLVETHDPLLSGKLQYKLVVELSPWYNETYQRLFTTTHFTDVKRSGSVMVLPEAFPFRPRFNRYRIWRAENKENLQCIHHYRLDGGLPRFCNIVVTLAVRRFKEKSKGKRRSPRVSSPPLSPSPLSELYR